MASTAYKIGDFIDYLESKINLPFIVPSSNMRPELPYFSVVRILANQNDIYQKGSDIVNNSEVITGARGSQFSFTAIGDVDTDDAENRVQELFNLLRRQSTIDFFHGRSESIRIISSPHARYVLEDNFGESRYGFDVEIGDIVEDIDNTKDIIETVTIESDGDKVKEIIITEES